MPDTQKKYDALAADLAEQPNVVRAKMFGMPSVRVNGNAFLGYFRGDLVCKLSGDVHAAAAPLFDQAFVDELLVALQHGQRIQAIVGGHVPHRRQRIAFLQCAFQNERHH